MRVDGSMPSGASKTSSTTVKESVSSNGQSSDFNKVLKSSVKSNNNFDKACRTRCNEKIKKWLYILWLLYKS